MSDFFYIKMAHAEREQKGLKMELYNTCARLTEEEYEKLCTQLAEKLKEQGNA